MTAVYLILAVLFGIAVWLFVSYNRFVEQRQLIDNSWSNVDTELQRRYDLIPNLVTTVKQYAHHETQVFESVTTARANAIASTGAVRDQAAAENQLVGALKSIFAVAEAYPQLRAADNFLSLQNELAMTENRIQAARRFFNGNIRDFNTRVQAVPSNFVASLFGFTKREYFEVESAIRDAGPEPVSFSDN